MTKSLLLMLLGAACASGWWAFGVFGVGPEGNIIMPTIFVTIGVFIVVAIETAKNLWES